jgi:hypothetical protein
MAYLRFSRDKRGYEQFALIQQTNNRRGGNRSRPRLLYFFRTPPNVKVGREPFDPEVRRLLETRNPGIIFDWDAIVSTPIPPVEVENWRERRRAERAARQAADAPEPSEASEPDVQHQQQPQNDGARRVNDGANPAAALAAAALPTDADVAGADGVVVADADADTDGESTDDSTETGTATTLETAAATQQAQGSGAGRRRRRRRRRRGGNEAIREVGQVAESPVVPEREPEPGNSDGEV